MRELITRTRRTNFCVNCSSELLRTDNFGSSDIEMGTGQNSLYESLSLVFNLKLLENVSSSSSSSLDLDLEVDNHPIIEENSHYSENEAQPAHCCNPDPGAIINNTFKLDLNPMLCLNCSMVFDVLYQLFVEFSNLRTTGSYLTRKIKQVEDLFVVLLAQSSLASASASASATVAVTEAEAEAVKTGGGRPAAAAAATTTTTTSASITMESSESIIMSTQTSDPTPMEVILLEPEPPKIISSENDADTDEIMISNLNFQELTMSTSDPVVQIPIPIPIDLCSVLEPVQPVPPTSIIAFDLAHMEDSSVRGILSDDETSSIQLDLDMFGGSDSGISAVDDLSVSDDIFKEIYFEAPGNNNDSNTPSINFHSTSSSTSSSLSSSEDSYTNALNEVLIPPLQLQPSASLQTQLNQNQQNDNCVHFDELEVDNFEHFSFASSSSCLNENDLTEAQQNNISIKIKTDNNKDTEDNNDNDVDVAMKQFFIPPLSILSPGIGTTTGISEAASPSPSSTSSTTSTISSTSSYLGKLLPFQAVQEAYPTDNELEEFKQSSLQPPFLCPKPKCNKKRFLHVTNYLRHVRTHLHMFRFKCPSASTCPHPYKNYKSLKEHCEKYHDCTPLPPSSNSSASSSASSKTFISRRGPRPPFKYQLFPTKTSPGTIKAILTTFTQSGLQGAEGDWTSIFDSNNSQTQMETKVEVDANLITSPELEFSTKIENESTTTATTTTTILTIINCDLERSIHLRNGSLNTVLPFPQCEPFNCPCPSSTSSPDPGNNDNDYEGSQDRTNQICPETYKTSKELTAHIRAIHGKFEYLYKCPQCAKLYPKKTQIFNNHLPVCGKEKDKSKYKIYLPPYICQVCNQEFPKREKLLKHCRRFHSDKDFKCDQCSRGFKLKQDLNRHMVTHTNERGHICGDCGKSYKTLGNLKFHFKISHTEEGRLQYNQYSRLKNQRIKLAKRSAENEKLTSN